MTSIRRSKSCKFSIYQARNNTRKDNDYLPDLVHRTVNTYHKSILTAPVLTILYELSNLIHFRIVMSLFNLSVLYVKDAICTDVVDCFVQFLILHAFCFNAGFVFALNFAVFGHEGVRLDSVHHFIYC